MKKTLFYCLLTWFIGILIDLPCLLGWGDNTYNTNTLNCVWDRTANHGFTILFAIFAIIAPCSCISFFYILIFVYTRKSKHRVANFITNKRRYSERSIRMAKGLFASFLMFGICWFVLVLKFLLQTSLISSLFFLGYHTVILNSNFPKKKN